MPSPQLCIITIDAYYFCGKLSMTEWIHGKTGGTF